MKDMQIMKKIVSDFAGFFRKGIGYNPTPPASVISCFELQ